MKNIFLLLLVVIMMACKDGKVVTPVASGRPYEMLVVINQDDWDAPMGQTLRQMLTNDIPGLPQPEAMFRLMHVSESDFDRTFQIFRNILIVDVNPKIYSKVSIQMSRDEYADGQMMMAIHAANKGQVIDYVETHPDQITDYFTNAEMNRQAQELKRKYNRRTTKMIDSLMQCRALVPQEVERIKPGRDFLWASTRSYDKNFVIYTYPYEGPHTFTKEYVLAKRDSVMKENVPGRKPGTWMATDTIFTEVRPIVVQGGYCLETRGLWQMEHDFLGGPFVSHSRVDTVNNRVVVAEGFIMEFEKKNGNLMRLMESALYTLNLPAKQ